MRNRARNFKTDSARPATKNERNMKNEELLTTKSGSQKRLPKSEPQNCPLFQILSQFKRVCSQATAHAATHTTLVHLVPSETTSRLFHMPSHFESPAVKPTRILSPIWSAAGASKSCYDDNLAWHLFNPRLDEENKKVAEAQWAMPAEASFSLSSHGWWLVQKLGMKAVWEKRPWAQTRMRRWARLVQCGRGPPML